MVQFSSRCCLRSDARYVEVAHLLEVAVLIDSVNVLRSDTELADDVCSTAQFFANLPMQSSVSSFSGVNGATRKKATTGRLHNGDVSARVGYDCVSAWAFDVHRPLDARSKLQHYTSL